MPYVERVTKAGNTIEIERYFTSRYKKKGISRGDKVKPTKEEQEKVNTRQAERKLRILINANYGYGDYHLVLDYIRRKGEPDRTPEQMRQDIDVFLRECRKEYRKAGLEFKYIHVMEIGKKGARHHHLVVNKIDTEILQRCWYKAYEGHNRVKVFPLDDSGNYAELASYLIKYTGTHKKGTDGALQGKHELGVEAYIRYMDDFVILSPDKEQLRNWLARIEQFLREELKLEFNPKTTMLAAKNGIDFVGYKHRATHRKVRKDSIKRIKRTIKKCESGKITKEQLQKSIQSWTGHAGHADSYNLRKKIETLAEAAIEKAA